MYFFDYVRKRHFVIESCLKRVKTKLDYFVENLFFICQTFINALDILQSLQKQFFLFGRIE